MDAEVKRLIKERDHFINTGGYFQPAGIIISPSAMRYYANQPRVSRSKSMPQATKRALDLAEAKDLDATRNAVEISLVSDPPEQEKADRDVLIAQQHIASLLKHMVKTYYPNGNIVLS